MELKSNKGMKGSYGYFLNFADAVPLIRKPTMEAMIDFLFKIRDHSQMLQQSRRVRVAMPALLKFVYPQKE